MKFFKEEEEFKKAQKEKEEADRRIAEQILQNEKQLEEERYFYIYNRN